MQATNILTTKEVAERTAGGDSYVIKKALHTYAAVRRKVVEVALNVLKKGGFTILFYLQQQPSELFRRWDIKHTFFAEIRTLNCGLSQAITS